jgi:hypothetical protein
MDTTIERLVRMLDEERVLRQNAEERARRGDDNYMTLRDDYNRANERRDKAEREVRAWQRWRDDLKAKVPKAKQTDWPETPDHDDIPF